MAETYNFLYEVPSNTLKAFEDYKNKQKKYEVMFFDMYVYSENVSNNRDKTWKLKKFPLHKKNGTKNTFFFLLRVPTCYSFTSILWSLYELKHKLCLSKAMFGIFHFGFCFVFIKVYNFVKENAWTLWL